MEGASLDLLDGVDSRRYLPYAVLATAVVIVLPALVVIPLAPFSGVPDLLLSAVLATGLSVVAGSLCSALWTRRPASKEIVFGDLMLWAWARRVRDERRLAKAVRQLRADSGADRSSDDDGDRRLAALCRLSVVFEARSAHTHGHTGRVTRHAERIAREMGLPPAEVARIGAAAAMHDVGKVAIPRSILDRDGGLTEHDQALVRRHAADGAAKVAAAGAPEIAAIVRHHHERVDGTGYPDGLIGDEIPLGARIVAVADAFDTLTSARPSAGARGDENALDILSERAGSQLDAEVVSAFVDYYSARRSIAGVALAATVPQRVANWLAATPAGFGTSVPPLAQGVCAAGVLALAGSCFTAMPASTTAQREGEPAPRRSDRAIRVERARPSDRAVARVPDRTAKAKDRQVSQRVGAGPEDDRSGAPVVELPQHPARGEDDVPENAPGGSTPAAVADRGAARPPPPPSEGEAPQPDAPASPQQLQLPDLPVDPTTVVAPVLDGVSKVLAPLPTHDLTAPVERLLDRIGRGISSR